MFRFGKEYHEEGEPKGKCFTEKRGPGATFQSIKQGRWCMGGKIFPRKGKGVEPGKKGPKEKGVLEVCGAPESDGEVREGTGKWGAAGGSIPE